MKITQKVCSRTLTFQFFLQKCRFCNLQNSQLFFMSFVKVPKKMSKIRCSMTFILTDLCSMLLRLKTSSKFLTKLYFIEFIIDTYRLFAKSTFSSNLHAVFCLPGTAVKYNYLNYFSHVYLQTFLRGE